MGEAVVLLERMMTALNDGDLETIRSLLRDDVVLVTPHGRRTGIEETMAWLAPFQSSTFCDVARTITRTTEEGARAVAEVDATLTHCGEWRASDGTVVPATAKRIAGTSVNVVDLRDGRIAEWRIYFDEMATKLALLG